MTVRKKHQSEQAAIRVVTGWGDRKSRLLRWSSQKLASFSTSSCVVEGDGYWERKRKHVQAFGQYLKGSWREGKEEYAQCWTTDLHSEGPGIPGSCVHWHLLEIRKDSLLRKEKQSGQQGKWAEGVGFRSVGPGGVGPFLSRTFTEPQPFSQFQGQHSPCSLHEARQERTPACLNTSAAPFPVLIS